MKTHSRWICLCGVTLLLSACSTAGPYPPPILIPDGRPTAPAMPYKVTLLANSAMPEGVMAIVPARPNLGPSQAAALAAFVTRQYSKAQLQKWRRLYIYVFRDTLTAGAFNAYWRIRRGAPLIHKDYLKLHKVWRKTLVRYEYRGRREYVIYPYKHPAGWWKLR